MTIEISTLVILVMWITGVLIMRSHFRLMRVAIEAFPGGEGRALARDFDRLTGDQIGRIAMWLICLTWPISAFRFCYMESPE